MKCVRILLVGAAAALLGACGVTAQGEPHPVELPRKPLTEPAASASATASPGEVAYVLCFVRDDRLVQVVRRAQDYPSVRRQLDELVAGPTPAESDTGLNTALGAMTVTGTVDTNARALVETAEDEEGGARSNEIMAYGQMVCTLTGRTDVSGVSFTRDGRRLEVPRADGTLTDEPLRTGDYAALLEPA